MDASLAHVPDERVIVDDLDAFGSAGVDHLAE
jgi:hypothetical protein